MKGASGEGAMPSMAFRHNVEVIRFLRPISELSRA